MEEQYRSPTNLQEAGYAPVWTSRLGYPGEIPEDIAGFICPDVEKGDYLVGPLSSIFWLKKAEFLNELIVDPSHKLEDTVYRIPDGGPWFWLVEALFDQDMIPWRYMNRISFSFESLDEALPQFPIGHNLTAKGNIPQQITTSAQIYETESLFPFFRAPVPPNISAAKLKWNRKKGKFVKEIESVLGDMNKGRRLYRAVTQKAIVSLMALFCPVISSSYNENEFGPGIYTSPSLETAVNYCIPGSALLVFDEPQYLSRYTLTGEEWDTTVRFWTGLQVCDVAGRVPPNWRGVDILEGAISREATKPRTGRVEGNDLQVVGVSLASVQAFASALRMVIWFT
ncbi:hypothetical protein N7532_007008 [Penicillium argentinense]|uniref:Uncharacterized protein n=1 Tax=Penicillium argentinense TaxID=1131581 RepID=A0A9W9KCI8_9EURO|nr:uncharacterized protein N7532_007008 [Penicillium argentinense]KAJ5100007.1 hypothetical protein N7532_007008 [Penicillium argentinense]